MVEEIAHIRKKAIKAQTQIIELKKELEVLQKENKDIENGLYYILINAIDEEELSQYPDQDKINVILDLLGKMKVVRLEAPINKIPEYCETVGIVKDSTKVNGTVVDIKKHGYRKDRVIIRKTHVIVVEN